MKPPAASPGRAEKPQLPAPAPPGLARLLLSKSRRGGGRSRRAPATSPMFVSRGRSRAADGEPSSPKVTCIGQVRMRKGKKGKKGAAAASKAAAPEKGAKGYCRCLKKAFLCGGLFDFDSRKRRQKAPSPEVESRARRSPWVFSSRDVAVAAVPKAADPRSGSQGEGHEDHEEEEMVVGVGVFGSIGREEGEKMGIGGGSGSEKEEDGDYEQEAQLLSSATTTPPKNALLLMRCRSAPQNRTSPLTSRFPAAAPAPVPSPSPTRDALAAVALEIAASPSPSPSPRKPERASPPPRKPSTEKVLADEDGGERRQEGAAASQEQDPQLIRGQEEEDEEDDDEFEDDEMRCSSARPLVLQRCKSEPATTAAAKMAAGAPGADAATAGCFWAHSGSSGRRRHAPAAAGAPVPLTGH
ncbi:hypothetical protein C2845_PM05G11120 [Panicum miliaceum]|uniref:Uncharacterized protein n=1 Tax=Panicum miliaceum TaxID=4540 RepID=A0A3L6T173_PANMI|nr:hypothetical protein C2845_PM05G11120 [Panicum miliaceum]